MSIAKRPWFVIRDSQKKGANLRPLFSKDPLQSLLPYHSRTIFIRRTSTSMSIF